MGALHYRNSESEALVCVQYTHQGDSGEVMSFRDHLRSDQHLSFVLEMRQNLNQPFGGCIPIRATMETAEPRMAGSPSIRSVPARRPRKTSPCIVHSYPEGLAVSTVVQRICSYRWV